MGDWILKLDEFLRISGRELLTNGGLSDIEDAKHQPVDRHFDEAIEKANRLEKKTPKKPKPALG